MKTPNLLMAAALSAMFVSSAFADEYTWKGGGDTLRWSDGSNWEGGVAPGAGDIAVIPDNTTAWASHYPAPNGDRTLLNTLARIRLDGANAVFELDCENDSESSTGCFSFSTPVIGSGHFVVKNTVANDRYAVLGGDSSAFTGVYDFTNAYVQVGNAKAIATGRRINVSGLYSQHGVKFCAGVYSNEIHVIRTSSSNPKIWGSAQGGIPVSTNLGVVVIEKTSTSVYLENIWCHTVSNLPNEASSLRVSGRVYIGPGGLYGRARMTDQSQLHLYGPNTGTGGYSPLGYNEGGHDTIYCHAKDVLSAVFFTRKTLDLGGYDQSNAVVANMGENSILTTDKPATLTWTGSNTTGNQTMSNCQINGPVSLVYNMGTSSKNMTFNTVTGTMSGSFIVKKSNVYFGANVNLPKLKKLAAVSTSKYDPPTRVYVQTANLNPGRLRLEISGAYSKIDIADGIQLDVRNFLLKGAYVKAGVYGSQAAHEAYPDLVDADHVLDTLTGTGTVKVRLDGEPGLAIVIR